MRPDDDTAPAADPVSGIQATAKGWIPPKVRQMATSGAEIAPTNNLDAEGHAS